MRGKRILAALAALTAALTVTTAPLGTVWASDGGSTAKSESADSEKLVIRGLKKPEQGRNLDKSAVAEYKGVKWELTVHWTDSKAKPAKDKNAAGKEEVKAEAGKSYRPFITFYAPAELEEDEVFAALESNGYFPEFIKNPLVIKEKYSDEDSKLTGQVWFIVADPVKCERTSKGSAGTPESKGSTPGTAPAAADTAAANTAAADTKTDDTAAASPAPATAVTSTLPAENVIAEEDVIDEEEEEYNLKHDKITMYCGDQSQYLVDKYGEETITSLIDEVRYVLEPQAVNLLAEKVWAYDEAIENGEVSSHIGFMIDDDLNGAMADAGVMYYPGPYQDTFYNRLRINPSSIYYDDDNDGVYERSDRSSAMLQYTLTHEMNHSFMHDYTRAGFVSVNGHDELVFPRWFVEGTASTVDGVFGYRDLEFQILCSVSFTNTWYNTETEELETVEFVAFQSRNPDILMKNYSGNIPDIARKYWKDQTGTDFTTFKLTDTTAPTLNQYCMGYLACLYLDSLASGKYGYADGKAPEDPFASEVFTNGFSHILNKLHNGKCLDDIIAEISPVDTSGKPVYANTAEFEEKFMTYGDNGISAKFVSDYLTQSYFSQNSGSGCILLPKGTKFAPFMTDEITEGRAYVIDSNYLPEGYAISDISGVSIGAGTSDYDESKDDITAGEAVAASAASAVTAAGSDEAVTEAADEKTAGK